ncbi:MAG: 4-hydroxy-tetrahydrodipicolinate reductase [Deltaproteobacteria bacterium]|nr:4-hydroxy-tetrahydrodipicolinate reductase [Deltaproteobacteria bacterium]
MVKAAVTGAAGRMGARIISVIGDTEGIELVGAIEHDEHYALGKDAGEVAGVGNLGVEISSDINAVMKEADVIIDFTFPDVTIENLVAVSKHKKAAVIGSTGFTASEMEEVKKNAANIPCIIAPNMSMGVNLMLKLVAEAARALGSDFDMEMVETHHKLKKDAPSGTAMKLAEVAAESVGRSLSEVGVFERHGMIGARSKEEIGVQTLRGGDVVGDHTVYFYGTGERLEITHRATSRDTFASGAVKGALWLVGKAPGIYDMQDVLGLK